MKLSLIRRVNNQQCIDYLSNKVNNPHIRSNCEGIKVADAFPKEFSWGNDPVKLIPCGECCVDLGGSIPFWCNGCTMTEIWRKGKETLIGWEI